MDSSNSIDSLSDLDGQTALQDLCRLRSHAGEKSGKVSTIKPRDATVRTRRLSTLHMPANEGALRVDS